MTLNRFFWELHQSTKFLTCTVFTLDFMFMNLAYQKRLLEKQDWVRFVLTLSDFFYNEPVFLKYVIHVVLSVKTCPKVHLIHDMCILCTSFLMYKLFLSSLSFFLSLSLVTHVIKTKINHFIQAECCCIIISTILTIVDTAGVGHALSLR